MKPQSPAYHLLALGLRLALVLALIFAGLSIYRRLPGDEMMGGTGGTEQTALLIVLQPNRTGGTTAADIIVKLYPIDPAAVQREYLSERRPGVRFDDFLARRMNGKSTIEAKLDERGQTTVMVTEGRWWLHAIMPGTESVEWRLPLNIAGVRQTVELTPDNAYAHMKSF